MPTIVGGGDLQYHYTNLTKTSQSEALCSLIMIYHLFIFFNAKSVFMAVL